MSLEDAVHQRENPIDYEHNGEGLNREHRAVIVVSDTHFGLEKCSKDAFERFLDWLWKWIEADAAATSAHQEADPLKQRLSDNGTQGMEMKSHAPDVIILLGDILELWQPRDDDRANPLRDSFEIFNKLLNLPRKKVYVIGNHDHELVDFNSVIVPYKSNDPKTSKGDYTCWHHTPFVIARDHYPNFRHKPEDQWLKIGSEYYYFMHGHQLDKWFRAVSDLQFTPGWMSQFASMYRGIKPWIGGLSSGVLLLSGALGILIATRVMSTPLWLVSLLAVASAYIAIPWLWVKAQRPLWKFIARHGVAPQFETVAKVAEDYFNPRQYKTDAKTIVFGHTHNPGYWRGHNGLLEGWTLVNTGSWVEPPEHLKEIKYNTFVYIDDKGPSVCRWVDDGKHTIEHIGGVSFSSPV